MAETVKKPMVGKSPITGDYFYFSRHKVLPSGKGVEVVGQKHDVTDSVRFLIEQEMAELLEAAKRALRLYEDPQDLGSEVYDSAAAQLREAIERAEGERK